MNTSLIQEIFYECMKTKDNKYRSTEDLMNKLQPVQFHSSQKCSMCRFTVPFSFLCYKCKTKYSTLYSTSCLQFYFNCPVYKAHNFSYLCLDTLLFCCCFFFCAFFTLVSLLRFFCKAYQKRALNSFENKTQQEFSHGPWNGTYAHVTDFPLGLSPCGDHWDNSGKYTGKFHGTLTTGQGKFKI